MTLSLAKREELFFILYSKLEKEDAEFLEKKILTFIIEDNNEWLKNQIKNIEKTIEGGFKYYDIIDQKNLGKISMEGFHNGFRRIQNLFESILNDNLNELRF